MTEVALSEVTDEFLAYVSELRGRSGLEELSSFLLVAATLLDLKTARLLPSGEVEDELDLELLEARDLLFARLLQYRAFKGVSAEFAERMAAASTRTPRAVPLEPAFIDLLPPLELTATPHALAAIFATVLQRDHTPPTVSIDHLHLPQVSVPEQRSLILARLRPGERLEFADLVADAEDTLVVVARFLALLELFKAGLCAFEQPEPLGPLVISGLEPEAGDASAGDGAAGADGEGAADARAGLTGTGLTDTDEWETADV
ncbi:segregation/condensation protein A [Brevibacterium ihuae]|uniref:segregation and condensation protein A n=1 Tax=Brevibacterium ihuae TaxID=1631743 RepID=UPI001FE3CA0E